MNFSIKNSSFKKACSLLLLTSVSSMAFAGIIPEKKRIIFKEDDKQQILIIANTNNYPILMQTWIDNGNIQNTPSSAISPFIITPPMSKLTAGEIKGLRIIHNKQKTLPNNKESAFWINLYEVPPTTQEDKLVDNITVAMNTQIKLFYRPSHLVNKPDEKKLVAQLDCYGKPNNKEITINCKNPTAYYISLSNIELSFNKQLHYNETQLDMMIPPFSDNSYRVKINTTNIPKQINVQYSFIDDNGDVNGLKSELQIQNK
ncbi:molecular chaperone [Orbaceae bacterium ac157xtp]